MLERLKERIDRARGILCCHSFVYSGLTGTHGAAAWLADKPEYQTLYVAMTGFYLAALGQRH